jgi:CheY-like chemotaxis protein
MMERNSLAGRHILVVEDEYFIAEEMMRAFKARGAQVLGPVPTLDGALHLVAGGERIDAAVLDINLQGEMVYPVAEALERRGVPFVFATGYDAPAIAPRHAAVARCEKPVDPDKVAEALFRAGLDEPVNGLCRPGPDGP